LNGENQSGVVQDLNGAKNIITKFSAQLSGADWPRFPISPMPELKHLQLIG